MITYISDETFAKANKLLNLDWSSNGISFLPDNVFADLINLQILDLSSNGISIIPSRVFANLKNLRTLRLSSNAITILPERVFANLRQLQVLDLSTNAIGFLPDRVFANLTNLRYLDFSSNVITSLPDKVFANLTLLYSLFLGANQLQNIPYRAFVNVAPSSSLVNPDHILIFSDNPIRTIEAEAFRWGDYEKGMHINPISFTTEAIHVTRPEFSSSKALLSALMASGFGQILEHTGAVATLLPCPLGTFSNSSTKGADGCTECPPGGFYSDDLGYVEKSCKRCPNGSFVSFEKAPGTRKQDCKSCPEGTETDFFAGYRACVCLEGFYRTHMFEKCHKCGQGGFECQDDYAILKAGYWWEWRNVTHVNVYRGFITNLLSSTPALDASSIQFPFPIPTPYKCVREESCKGGLHSQCDDGYEGPLCGVCSPGYYKQLQTCTQCPSKKWIAGQLSIIAAIFLIITVVLVWTSKREKKKKRASSVIDLFLSKVKIVIGFYQVTHGLLQAFSYITWPGSLQAIAKYSEILQMDVLQIAPIHCLFSGLRANAFDNLLIMMAINAAVIAISVAFYEVRKVIIFRSRSILDNDKSRKISQTKEFVFRNLFFFLYVTYLSTCAKTASVLPMACQKLCRDEKEELCFKYMKADYSIQCQGAKYSHWLIVAYISTAYIVTLPVSSFIALWRQRRQIITVSETDVSQDVDYGMEMISGLRFLFENYKHDSWYWELVEMSRKVILTSGIILVGHESRSYIGLAWVIAGMYGMLFSWIKPIGDLAENRLMATSLAVTVVNLGVGAVSRIPAENLPATTDTYTDAVLFKILVLGANTLVIGLLAAQYAMFLYRFLKEWRKNPHWSFSCCLGLLLPLNDLQGEIHGIAETDILENQLQSGQIDEPTILSEVKNSGAMDVTFEEDDEGDDNTVKVQDENCQDAEHSDTRRHQGTQTELYSSQVVHKPTSELLENSLSQPSIPANMDDFLQKNEGSYTGNGPGKAGIKHFASGP
ncbi:hypothetical protein ACROYT_G025878 [Oculina patagonica]